MKCILFVVHVTMYAWYFAVAGGTIGPFISEAQCIEVREEFLGSAWKSRCWEFKRGWSW